MRYQIVRDTDMDKQSMNVKLADNITEPFIIGMTVKVKIYDKWKISIVYTGNTEQELVLNDIKYDHSTIRTLLYFTIRYKTNSTRSKRYPHCKD